MNAIDTILLGHPRPARLPLSSSFRPRPRGVSRFTARPTLQRPAWPASERSLLRLPNTSDPPLTPLSPHHSHPTCARRVVGVRLGRGHSRRDSREGIASSVARGAFDRLDLG
jgi:hypothetical protein